MKERANKGFSMVELIVAIAIMAVMVGVLAPAYLKYVEKSRKSADISAMGQVLDAGLAVATDEEFYIAPGTEFHVDATDGEVWFSIPVWTATANGVVRTDKEWERAENEWLETSNEGDPYRMRAKDWSVGSGQIIGTIESDGSMSWKISGEDGVFNDMVSYSRDFAAYFTTSEETDN